MSSTHWDVIIVGARCAGAALATHLARAGVRTLVVDADPRGSDLPLSTHYVQPPGMLALDRLGVAEQVRAVTPASRRFRLALDDVEMITPLHVDRPGYCVRRITLDPLLQDAAEASGAVLRCGTRVTELVRRDERVMGVVVRTASGAETLTADFVVGADGMHSTVAKQTGAREYLASDSTRGGYFGYYPAPSSWTTPWDATLEYRADGLRYVFRCDGDRVLLVSVPPLGIAQSWGRAHRERLQTSLLESPTTRTFAEGKEPIGKLIGLLRTRFFYREPVGAGWALVGDAGHYKDFVTGQGISDALLAAERLARALLAPVREPALAHFWRERDCATLPLHFDALEKGHADYNTPFMRWVIEHMAQAPALGERVRLMLEREITPQELVPMRTMLGFMGSALLRGRFDVLSGFLAVGKRKGKEQRELDARAILLEAAAASLRDGANAAPSTSVQTAPQAA
jgi:flavin-dependent dehydrogenase